MRTCELFFIPLLRDTQGQVLHPKSSLEVSDLEGFLLLIVANVTKQLLSRILAGRCLA